jgi:hypothetical protein
MVINRHINKNDSYEVILGRESLKLLPLTLNLMTGELSSITDNSVLKNVDKVSSESNVYSLENEIVNKSLESPERRGESEKRLNEAAKYQWKSKSKASKNLAKSENKAQIARKIRICYFCRQHGHLINDCPKKIHADKAVKVPSTQCYYASRMEPTQSNKNNR